MDEYLDEYLVYNTQCNTSPVEYENEIMELKEALQVSQLEVEHLKTMLSNAKSLIRQMEIELFKTQEDFCYRNTEVGKSTDTSSDSSISSSSSSDEHDRKKRGFSKEVLERWEFYNKHKSDPDILGTLQAKFKSIGIDNVPWHLVKKKTDEMFYKRRKT